MASVTVAAPQSGVASSSSGEAEAGQASHSKVVAIALALAIATMPILVPAGPGNTAAADLSIAAACLLTGIWLHRIRARVRVPYLLPVSVLMLAGGVATYFSGDQMVILAVIQDGFCLLWAAGIANAVRLDPRLLRVVVATWVRSGIFWAGVLCFGRLAGISWLAGITARDGTRASLTFGDPNLAGNFFVCCFALLLATSVVRHRWARWAGGAVLLLALVFTGSNGAALGLIIVVGVGGLGAARRRLGATAMVAVGALLGAAAILVAPHVSLTEIQQKAANSVAILHDSLGRAYESSGTRELLVSEAFDIYLHDNLVGVGPTRTKATLQERAAPYVKEAHNDYTATIVERGLAGGVGLVLLIWVVGTRFGRVAAWRPKEGVAEVIPRPEYLLGLVCAFAVAGVFYEVLHFRHLWALLGLGAGIDPGDHGDPRDSDRAAPHRAAPHRRPGASARSTGQERTPTGSQS
jgi:O-antigen ligase